MPTARRNPRPAPPDVPVEVRPVTPDRWDDLVDLFERRGPRGGQPVTSGCWCMYWRLDNARFDEFWGRGSERGKGNRAAMREIVAAGREPGLLAYAGGVPVGWVSVAPRSEFPRIESPRSPLRPLDDVPVWSIVCFYVHASHKRSGVASALLKGAIDHARGRGATTLEAYGVKAGDGDPYTGFRSMYEAAGFNVVREAGRRSIMRYTIAED